MGETTTISWCDKTFNPWEGCTKVSAGCLHCYAETRNHRFGNDNWGKGKPRRRTSAANWKQPLKWNRIPWICPHGHGPYSIDAEHSSDQPACSYPPSDSCCECGKKLHRARVFCASLADWLDDEVPIEWLSDLLKLIHDTPNLDWLLLTKRPENWLTRIKAAQDSHFDNGDRNVCGWLQDWWKHLIAPKNVWIGTSVENQAMANERIPQLLTIQAKIRFLSMEPLLEAVRFKDALRCDVPIHWVILGGESGANARPCALEWIRNAAKQCQESNVSCFVKQLGADPFVLPPTNETYCDGRFPKSIIKDKKGGNIAEFPEDLRIRQFPA